jgi:hypothetical protein
LCRTIPSAGVIGVFIYFSPIHLQMPIRRSIALYLFVILSSAATAQVRVGIKGGADFARLLDAVEGYNGSGSITLLNTDSGTYFYGGVFADIHLGKGKENMFYRRPQLEYVGGGGQLPLITDYNGNAIITRVTAITVWDVGAQTQHA